MHFSRQSASDARTGGGRTRRGQPITALYFHLTAKTALAPSGKGMERAVESATAAAQFAPLA